MRARTHIHTILQTHTVSVLWRRVRQPVSCICSLRADAHFKLDSTSQALVWYRFAVQLDVYNIHVSVCSAGLLLVNMMWTETCVHDED